MQRIRCPFLLTHGEGDAQIPLAVAQKCFDAVGSTRKTFKVFTREEGGYHHCQSDNVSLGTAYMWDWLEDGPEAQLTGFWAFPVDPDARRFVRHVTALTRIAPTSTTSNQQGSTSGSAARVGPVGRK